jgi:hypothetical protein
MLSRAILVKDLIESQRNTIQMSSQSDFMGGTASVGICGTGLLEGHGQHLLTVLLLIPFNYLPLIFNFEQSRLE